MRNKFARTMNEAFPHTADAAQWLESPELTGVSPNWFIKVALLVSVVALAWGLL